MEDLLAEKAKLEEMLAIREKAQGYTANCAAIRARLKEIETKLNE